MPLALCLVCSGLGRLRRSVAGSIPLRLGVFEESCRSNAETVSDLQQGQDAGVAAPVFDIDQAAEAQLAPLGEFLQAEVPFFAQPSDAHAQLKQPRLGGTVLR